MVLKTSLALLALLSSFSSAQLLETKIIASDGSTNDSFGGAVAVTDSFVIVGTPEDDVGGTSTGSAYIYRWDGSIWGNEVKITASDAAPGDFFGRSVAMTNNVAVVGAASVGPDRGAVYVFERNGSAWNEVAKLTASDAGGGNFFGWAVDIDGSTIVAGAYANNLGKGAAYVFGLESGLWVEQAKLTASDAANSDFFGVDVSVSGDWILVGAQWDDDHGLNSGAAYVFDRNGTMWVEDAKLTATDGAVDDLFGSAVSIDRERVVIGAQGDDDAGMSSGAAYVFSSSGGQWSEDIKLTASDAAATDFFGLDVSINGESVLIGSSLDDAQGLSSGSAYLFTLESDVWVETSKLIASDGETGDHFGQAVTIGELFAVIGAPDAASGATGAGAAYIFSGFSTGVPCEEVDFFGAKCSPNGTAQAMVKLFNSTIFAGETIDIQLDDSVYSIELITNGIHSIGRLQVHQAGFGQHTVTLVDPAGCYDPVEIVCQVSGGPVEDDFDLLWEDRGYESLGEKLPEETRLIGNFPNPFNPMTTISYELTVSTHVTLIVTDIIGREVSRLVDGYQDAGYKTVSFDASSVASGIYFYRLQAGDFVETRKLILIK